MRLTRKILIVARREFIVTATRKTFLLVTFGMPLLIGGMVGIGALIGAGQLIGNQQPSIALVDQAKIVKPNSQTNSTGGGSSNAGEALKHVLPTRPKLVSYPDIEQALAALMKEEVSVCYLIEPDYLATGKITSFTRENRLSPSRLLLAERELIDLIRASLLEGQIKGKVRDRILSEPQFQNRELSPLGEIKSPPDLQRRLVSAIGSIFFVVLLTLSIFMSSSYLLQSLAAEKQNRVVEVLLSSLEHEELLAGKVLGLGLVGLLQSGVFAILIGLPLIPFLGGGSRMALLLSPIYIVLGYLFFASLMVATSVFFSGEQETNQVGAVWMTVSLAPLGLLALSPGLDSWASKIFSYIPLTAPITMILRLSWDKAGAADVLISISTLTIGICLAVYYAARLFRLASLMYGKPPSVTEILRLLRNA